MVLLSVALFNKSRILRIWPENAMEYSCGERVVNKTPPHCNVGLFGVATAVVVLLLFCPIGAVFDRGCTMENLYKE